MKEWGCAWRCMRHWSGAALAVMALLFASGLWLDAQPSPVSDAHTGLPIDSELDEDAIDIPREVFHSEALHGRKSYFSNLGNLAFNSPYVLGGAARKARISCGTCHVNGASNPKLFIPGLSTRPGNFDTTSSFFNPKTDNGVLDPVAIPSLRGARFWPLMGMMDAPPRYAISCTTSSSMNSRAPRPRRRFSTRSWPISRISIFSPIPGWTGRAPRPRRRSVAVARRSAFHQALPA